MDDQRCASVAEHGVGVGAEVYILVLELPSGFAFRIDTEVRQVAGMVALGIFQTVLFPLGIEMRAGRFEIRCIAFGILMEMNGVLAGGKTVKMKLEADTWSLLRKHDCADGLALCVLEFNFGFGGAGERGDGQNHRECDRGPD